MKSESHTYPTWDEMLDMKESTVLRDWMEDNIRCLIVRGPASVCAYMGIPIDHPLANQDYVDINVTVHGGLTYSSEGDGAYFPAGYFWWGWDYAHYNDYTFYYDIFPLNSAILSPNREKDKKWTGGEVEQEVKEAVKEFKILCSIAENPGTYIHID